MTDDQWAIIGIGAAWAGAAGLLGLLFAWVVRRRSFRWQVGVGRPHRGAGRGRRRGRHGTGDVPLRPRPRGRALGRHGGRRRRDGRLVRHRHGVRAVVADHARGRPPLRRERSVRGRLAWSRRAPGAQRRAGPDRPPAAGVTRARAAARGVAARAGLVGVPRPALAPRRDARDDRGARGRAGRRPRSLPPPDPRRGRPDGAHGRRPLRALPDPRRGAAAEPPAGRAGRRGQRGAGRRRPGRARRRRTPRRARGRRPLRHRRPRRAVAGGVQPAHQRDPAHARRRGRRGHRPARWATRSSSA